VSEQKLDRAEIARSRTSASYLFPLLAKPAPRREG
jgi:hypothetical protein